MKKLKPSTVIPSIKPTNSFSQIEIIKYMVLKDFWSYLFYPIPETWNEITYKFEFLKYQGKSSVFLDYEFENQDLVVTDFKCFGVNICNENEFGTITRSFIRFNDGLIVENSESNTIMPIDYVKISRIDKLLVDFQRTNSINTDLFYEIKEENIQQALKLKIDRLALLINQLKICDLTPDWLEPFGSIPNS